MPPPDVMDAVTAATRIIAELMQMGAKLGLPMAPESKAPTSGLNPHTPGACPSGPETNMVAEVAATALAASKGNPAAAIMDLLHRVVKRKLAGLRALQASCTATSLAGTRSADPPAPGYGDVPQPAWDVYGGQHDDGYDAMAIVHHDHNTTLGMLRATGKRNSSGMVCLGGTSPHARTPAKNEGSLVLPNTPFSAPSVGPGSAGSASLPRLSSGTCAAGFATWPGASTPSRSLLRAPGHPTPDSSHPTSDNSARDGAHVRTMQHPRPSLEAGAVGLHPMPGQMPLLSSEMDPLSPSHSAPPAFLDMAYPERLFSQANGLNGGGPVAHGQGRIGHAPVSATAQARHGRLGYDFARGLDECDPNMLVDGAPFPMPGGTRSVQSCSSLPAQHLVPFPSLRPVRVSHRASPFRPPMPPPPNEVDPLAASSAPLVSYSMHEAAAPQQQQPSTVFTAASSLYSAHKGRHSQPGHTSQPLPYPNPSTPLSSMPQQLLSISSPHHFPAQYSHRPSPAMRQQPYYSQTRMELAEATPTKSAGQLQYLQPPTPRQPPVSMPHFGGQLLHGALIRANAAPAVACSSMPEATSLQDGDVDCVMDGMLHGDNYLSW